MQVAVNHGRCETLSQCCSNAGPPSSMAASVWRLVGVPLLRLLPMMIDCYTLPHFQNQ